MTYAEVPEDDDGGATDDSFDSSVPLLLRLEETDDGVGVGLLVVLLVQSLEL